MSIEGLGSSLLSAARARTKENEKRKRNALYAGLAGKLVGQIGNAYLESQAKKFFNNEQSIQERLAYKNAFNAYSSAQETEKQAQSYESGYEQYWVDKARAEAAPTVEAFAGDKYNPAQVKRVQDAWAMQRAKQLREAHSNIIKAGQDFQASGAITPETYDRMLASKKPLTMGGFVKQKLAQMFDGDPEENTAEAIRSSELLKNAEEVNTFNQAYSQLKNANLAFELVEVLKETDLGEAPLTRKTETFSSTDEFGNKVTETRVAIYQGNSFVDYENKEGTGISGESPASLSYEARINKMPETFASNTQTRILSDVDEDVKTILMDSFEASIGEVNSDDPNAQKLVTAANKRLFGGIGLTERSLQTRFGFDGATALNIAATKHAENYKAKQEGVNLIQSESGFSPLLTLAAMEEMANKDKIDLERESEFIATLIDSPEFEQNFDNLSQSGKIKALKWMDNYRIFSKIPVSSGQTIKNIFENKYGLGPKEEEKEQEETTSSDPYSVNFGSF